MAFSVNHIASTICSIVLSIFQRIFDVDKTMSPTHPSATSNCIIMRLFRIFYSARPFEHDIALFIYTQIDLKFNFLYIVSCLRIKANLVINV